MPRELPRLESSTNPAAHIRPTKNFSAPPIPGPAISRKSSRMTSVTSELRLPARLASQQRLRDGLATQPSASGVNSSTPDSSNTNSTNSEGADLARGRREARRRVDNMGIREQQQYASRLARENFDIKLKVRFEKEKSAQLQREVLEANKRTTDLQQVLDRTRADVDTLQAEIEVLHRLVKDQETTLENATLVTKAYDERLPQLEHSHSLAEMRKNIFADEYAEPSAISDVPTPELKVEVPTPPEEEELEDPFADKKAVGSKATSALRAAFMAGFISPNQQPSRRPSRHSRRFRSPVGSMYSRSNDRTSPAMSNSSEGSLELPQLDEADFASIYGPTRGEIYSDVIDDDDRESLLSPTTDEDNEDFSLEHYNEQTKEYAIFFDQAKAKLDNWAPIVKEASDVGLSSPTQESIPLTPDSTEFPPDNNDISGSTQIAPDVDMSLLDSPTTPAQRKSKGSEMSYVHISTEPEDEEVPTLIPGPPQSTRRPHLSTVLETPEALPTSLSKASAHGKTTLTPRTRYLVTEVAESVCRKLGFSRNPRVVNSPIHRSKKKTVIVERTPNPTRRVTTSTEVRRKGSSESGATRRSASRQLNERRQRACSWETTAVDGGEAEPEEDACTEPAGKLQKSGNAFAKRFGKAGRKERKEQQRQKDVSVRQPWRP